MPRPGSPTTSPSSCELTGEAVNVLRVDDITPLPGNGLIVGHGRRSTPKARRDRRRSSPRPCARWRRSPRRPEVGLEAAIVAVPDLAADPRHAGRDPRRDHRGVARAGPGGRAASAPSNPPTGTASIDFMTELGLVPEPGHRRRPHRHRPAAGQPADRHAGWRPTERRAAVVVAARGAGRGGGCGAAPGRGRAARCVARRRPMSSSSVAATPGCGPRSA